MNYLNTQNYRDAVANEGELAYEWKDKPHRLVHDLCAEVERLQLILIDNNQINDIILLQKDVYHHPYEEFHKPNIEKIQNYMRENYEKA